MRFYVLPIVFSSGRQCVSAEDEQESKFKDIILMMEMLANLMSKDILGTSKGKRVTTGNTRYISIIKNLLLLLSEVGLKEKSNNELKDRKQT